MTYKKFMSLFLLAGSIVSTLCSCAATDSSAVVGYVDEQILYAMQLSIFARSFSLIAAEHPVKVA